LQYQWFWLPKIPREDHGMIGRFRWPTLSCDWMRASIAPALVFMATATDQQYLTDFWHHLVRGRTMVTAGHIASPDLSTFTVPVRDFQDANWLTQIVYYHLYGLGGLPLIQLINALVLAAMMLWLVSLCRRVSHSWGIAAILGVFCAAGLWQSLTIRPQTFSFLLFVALYDLLERSAGRRWLLLLPPLMLALWVNLHGAFPIGLALLGLYWLAAVWEHWPEQTWRFWIHPTSRDLALCLAASTLAILLNPFGWDILHFVGTTVSSASARGIDEWVPPSPANFIGKVWVLSMLLVLAAFGLGRPRPTPREVLLAVGFLPLACGSVRMVPWWLLVIAPMLAVRLADLVARLKRSAEPEAPGVGPAVCFGLILLMVVFSIPGLNRYNPLLGSARRTAGRTQTELEQVTAYLNGHSRAGRIFSRFEWGEYLTWSLAPGFQVFMDGWIDRFPDPVWTEYASVTTGRIGWEAVLERYGVEYLLVDLNYHGDTGLLDQVERSGTWAVVYQAGDARLYARRASTVGRISNPSSLTTDSSSSDAG
jgi:hypothetical protein